MPQIIWMSYNPLRIYTAYNNQGFTIPYSKSIPTYSQTQQNTTHWSLERQLWYPNLKLPYVTRGLSILIYSSNAETEFANTVMNENGL